MSDDVPIVDALDQLGFDDLDLGDGTFVEGAVVILKLAHLDGTSSLRNAAAGVSHWESLGMLLDSLDGERNIGWGLDDDVI